MKQVKPIFVSNKQLLAIQTWFDDVTEDMLYGGAARGGKSETIGIILAICIAYFPGSNWLISRTQLSDLKATTLATFFDVLGRFGYGDKSYRDKIRDEKHILFDNKSKLFVLQVNLEPSDPEFDRIGSYSYTGGFLDEGQQMSNKVREVLQGRLSELNGSFQTEVDIRYKDVPNNQIHPSGQIEFLVTEKVVRKDAIKDLEKRLSALFNIVEDIKKGLLYHPNGSLIETDKIHSEIQEVQEDIKDIQKVLDNKEGYETVTDNGRIHFISRREFLTIPWTMVDAEVIQGKLIHTYGWNFKGCIFTGCNPGTNFTRSEFYRPYKEKKLPSYMSFIPALVNDNPWVEKRYITRLQRLPETSVRKQRLLYGNFDYDDDPSNLFDQNTVEQIFKREPRSIGNMFMTIDASRMGKDTTQVGVWQGLDLIKIVTLAVDDVNASEKHNQMKKRLTTQAITIEGIARKYGVRLETNCIVDEIGVGGGLVDLLGCIGFVGNSQPMQPFSSKFVSWKKMNYSNLRTQAFYYLRDYLGDISVSCDPDTQQTIIEELLVIKEKNVTDETKLQIIKKSDMIEELGRSPDLADMLSMRLFWVIREHHLGNVTIEDEMKSETTDDNFLDGLIMEMEKENSKNRRNTFEPDLDIYD